MSPVIWATDVKILAATDLRRSKSLSSGDTTREEIEADKLNENPIINDKVATVNPMVAPASHLRGLLMLNMHMTCSLSILNALVALAGGPQPEAAGGLQAVISVAMLRGLGNEYSRKYGKYPIPDSP
mmetsp:Transcript_60185/g.152622  ORF Transcript_60185/g.152622 Transcript_60185/m.152622 type:complete len:127 (+) Transcript_60185:170-550(+)